VVVLGDYVIAPQKVFVSLSMHSWVGRLPLLKRFVTVCHQHTSTKEESASDKADREPWIPNLIWRIHGQVRNITLFQFRTRRVRVDAFLVNSIGWAATRHEQT
jgi:hypothetical protein